tara:strand:- start:927 stop:1193 length:267 start_codon:yes stop_codon:yes gene_type:complete
MKEKSQLWGRYRTTTYDWYLKWLASIIILCAMSIRGTPELAPLDLQLSIIGVFLWLIVSLVWKDRALILLNGVGLLFLVKNYILMMEL